ncbi:MAG TPA: beta-galactosidase [Candidatus Saccharimonadales bacterium]|nr:beta-galactosidase [Candidatus Saccharimonadales bacterium]
MSYRYWSKSIWHKIISIVFLLLLIVSLGIFGIGEWYIRSEAHIPLQLGVSFIPDYAQSLGLDPQNTMDALTSIGVKQFRLVSYWSDLEPSPGKYDFSQLDWEFQKAVKAHASVILTLGLRQPRWPECHAPTWVNTSAPESQWEPQLLQFMSAVINRYKNSPALEKYQLENEYFLQGFGNCTNDSRSRLVSEYNLIKKLDPAHPVVVGRSNNAIGFPDGAPKPDEYGISVYKRVWDAGVTHRYLEYPFPAWYYAFLAGWQKIFLHRDMMIDELQAEAWPPHGQTITQTSLTEQNKSINASRLMNRFAFGKATGMKQIEMWGAEYWYYRKVILHDPSLWNVAKKEFSSDKQ